MILAWREHIRVAEFQFSLCFWVTLHFLTAILLAYTLLRGCFSICKVGWMITILAGFFFCTSALLAFLSHDLWLQPQALARSTPLPGALVVKNLPANAWDLRDVGSIRGLGRFPGGGHDNPLQYSCLESSMARGAWWDTVHRVTQSWTRLKQLMTHACTPFPNSYWPSQIPHKLLFYPHHSDGAL